LDERDGLNGRFDRQKSDLQDMLDGTALLRL